MKNEKSSPLAYMVTCRTYASWLHGDERKSVDREHNMFLMPKINKNPYLQKNMRTLCKENMFLLNETQRKIILQSIIKTCQFANWHLYAAHVRSNHMHIVVEAKKNPEQMAVSFKAYATRDLKQYYSTLNRERFWSRGASTGYIFTPELIFRAMQYTVEEQGEEMAVYYDKAYYEGIV